MTLRTGGRGGKMEKKITVFSNDPENPQLALSISCDITVDVAVEPRQIVFGQIGKGETAEQGFAVTVNEPDKIKITGVTIDDEHFGLTLLEGGAGGTAKYKLTFKGGASIGRMTATVKIAYEGSTVPELAVPVRAEIVGDLVYNRSLYFNKKDDAFPQREIAFTSRSGKTVKLTKVEDAEGKLKTEIRYEDNGTKAVLVAVVADPAASYAKPTRHKLVVHTSDKDQPTVEIPYTISERVRGAAMRGGKDRRKPPMPFPPRAGIEKALKLKAEQEKAAKKAEAQPAGEVQ